MAGYLDTYGVTDAKRERVTKRLLIIFGIAIIVGLVGFLFFRNFFEKRAFDGFLNELRAKNYQQAYQTWGCTPQAPCRDYAFEKFMEDWGPKGQYANADAARVTNVDSCGGGVVLTVEFPKAEPTGIWVERSTKVLGFAPWPRCPGRHFNPGALFKSWFSSPPPPELPKR